MDATRSSAVAEGHWSPNGAPLINNGQYPIAPGVRARTARRMPAAFGLLNSNNYATDVSSVVGVTSALSDAELKGARSFQSPAGARTQLRDSVSSTWPAVY